MLSTISPQHVLPFLLPVLPTLFQHSSRSCSPLPSIFAYKLAAYLSRRAAKPETETETETETGHRLIGIYLVVKNIPSPYRQSVVSKFVAIPATCRVCDWGVSIDGFTVVGFVIPGKPALGLRREVTARRFYQKMS